MQTWQDTGVVMGKADHLTTRATELFVVASKAREEGLVDYAEELASQGQRDLNDAIAVVSAPATDVQKTAQVETPLAFDIAQKSKHAPFVRSPRSANNRTNLGWILCLAGTIVWLYGYFTTGNPSFTDWHANAPRWIAEFLPNMESEIGMILMLGGMVLLYLPRAS
jgi:hypothetical protein